jgi:hypothetical protein
VSNKIKDRVVYFSKEEYRAIIVGQSAFGTHFLREGFIDSRLRASLGPLIVSQLDLYGKHIPLSGYRVPHDQETDVFVIKRVKLSKFYFDVAHSNIVIGTIIINLGVQVSNSAVVVIVEAKIGISASFSIVKALVVHVISASFIIVKARSPPLLLCVD